MKISTAFPAAKLASVLAVLALCGIIGSNLSSVASVGRDEREGLFIPFFNFFRRSNLFTKRIDSGTNATFYISRNEWQLFEVFQEPETMCSCTATCLDPASRIDFYMTYDPRQTLPSNTQKCEAPPPVSGDICWVAVRGDKINRPHQACQISCVIDKTT